MARFVSHLDSLLSLVLDRTYSSSYLSLILAYSWSSSVILNAIKISLVRSKDTMQLSFLRDLGRDRR